MIPKIMLINLYLPSSELLELDEDRGRLLRRLEDLLSRFFLDDVSSPKVVMYSTLPVFRLLTGLGDRLLDSLLEWLTRLCFSES